MGLACIKMASSRVRVISIIKPLTLLNTFRFKRYVFDFKNKTDSEKSNYLNKLIRDKYESLGPTT